MSDARTPDPQQEQQIELLILACRSLTAAVQHIAEVVQAASPVTRQTDDAMAMLVAAAKLSGLMI